MKTHRTKPKQLTIRMIGPDTAEVLLYDVISGDGDGWFGPQGISAKVFRQQVKAIRAKTINLRINCMGGSVIEAAAMLNALDEWKATGKRIEVDIDGVAASAASFVAMAGDVVRMASNGLMMIHNPTAGCQGGVDDMRRTADLLEKVREQIIDAYMRRCTLPREAIGAAMAAETWYTGQEAIAAGLADSVGGAVQMAAFARFPRVVARLKYQHPPAIPMKMPAETAPAELPRNEDYDDDDGCCLEVGDRVVVVNAPHAPGQVAGMVRQAVSGPAYGIEFDNSPGAVYQWYVGSEIMLENPLEEDKEEEAAAARATDDGMPVMAKKKEEDDEEDDDTKNHASVMVAAWEETKKRREIAAKLIQS